MKIHLVYKFTSGPWGGGNQFLKGLHKQLVKQNAYAASPAAADAILFNSHHQLGDILDLKLKYPAKTFVHRLDGPIYYSRGRAAKKLDRKILQITQSVADLSIFQSRWSLNEAKKMGYRGARHLVIPNAPDPAIFHPLPRQSFNPKRKTRLIATSWSNNWNKGFKTFQYLDQHLDFNQYSFVFIGNSPLSFENIQSLKPLPSQSLARYLQKSDIFITATQHDSCSNSLLEALASGLPAVALNSGGNPEIVKRGGETFDRPEEILEKIVKIKDNYASYQQQISLASLAEVSRRYRRGIERCHQQVTPKKISRLQYFWLKYRPY